MHAAALLQNSLSGKEINKALAANHADTALIKGNGHCAVVCVCVRERVDRGIMSSSNIHLGCYLSDVLCACYHAA